MAHKIQISRGAEATQPAVERHFREQLLRYGEVHTVNLLAQKEHNPELALSAAYVKAVQTLSDKRALVLPMTNFDYHAECKGGNYENVTILTRRMSNEFERFGYFLGDAEGDQNGILLKQQGVFRTNCVDWWVSC
ncbi:SacI homology domain-containing protein [Jimgerdemannia flammicorona]|uniref:SacI homology domain-containing protein n=1 Tax=Jimgerdemannia flammicorona TaxID=994334 RepID=A0A433PGA3_9FUNG|nr:SacI homology domain-containing protein [Jimgerdemannia flammicorona]